MKKPKKGILLFDLEFTLIDYLNGIKTFLDAYKNTFKALGANVNELLIEEYIARYNLDELICSFGIKTTEFWKVFEKFGDSARLNTLTSKSIFVYPEVSKVLTALRQEYLIGIVSNITQSTLLKILSHLDLINKIDVCVGTSKHIKPKPSPDLILNALRKLKFEKNVALIGDSDQDVFAGKALNLKTILVSKKNYKYSTKPDMYINSISDLLVLLHK